MLCDVLKSIADALRMFLPDGILDTILVNVFNGLFGLLNCPFRFAMPL
jgi:hypothetical protein